VVLVIDFASWQMAQFARVCLAMTNGQFALCFEVVPAMVNFVSSYKMQSLQSLLDMEWTELISSVLKKQCPESVVK
jgi:hypothetical protein